MHYLSIYKSLLSINQIYWSNSFISYSIVFKGNKIKRRLVYLVDV